MRHLYKILSAGLMGILILLGPACKKQDYYQTNPNNPSAGTPALFLTNVEISVFNNFNLNQHFAARHLTYYVFLNSTVQYDWTRANSGSPFYNFDNYNVLRQVNNMSAAAESAGQINYQALAKFFRAVLFIQLTETYGDVPFTEALQATTGLITPKYDTQKSIYQAELKELEEANDLFDESQPAIAGDIIYSGSILKWKQLINAYRLRVLLHLSKKESDNELNIKQQFAAILSNPTKYPLMTSNDDNGQIAYNTSDISNNNPNYLSNDLQSGVSVEKGFVDLLKGLNDTRLFSFADPINGQAANIFSSYVGVDAGLTQTDQQNAGVSASRINKRYIQSQTNEPHIFLGYAEQEFLIAEGISRGWGTGNAALHYNNGITASMAFYGITGTPVSTYLAQPGVAFNPANAIPLIQTQKHIAFYMNSGWEAFFEQRRTGIPTLSVGPGTQNNGKVPKRWLYPQGELTNNATNLDAAVQSQYGGTDDTNAVMWVLK
jgi:hypothetical protein